jgi:hypothetical protein
MKAYAGVLQTQVEMNMLDLGRCVNALGACHDPLAVTALVSDLLTHTPAYLPSETILARKLLATIDSVQRRLVADFHDHFEQHMGGQENSTLEADPDVLWSSFRGTAAKKLLGIFLVSLLPLVVGESTLAKERYIEALDSSLTPLWGRFHFHLSQAREEASSRQLAWTFRYAKSFVEMLHELCGEVSSAPQLQEIRAEDYVAAARSHVCEKASKFMRAHVAMTLQHLFTFPSVTVGVGAAAVDAQTHATSTSNSTSSSSSNAPSAVLPRLVEDCIDFDVMLRALSPHPGQLEFTTDTLYDARCARGLWVRLERGYFASVLAQVCTRTGNQGAFAPHSLCRDLEPCYRVVFEVCFLLSVASQRYARLSARARRLMCAAVLEPLALSLLVAVLYRIRSHPQIKSLAAASAPTAGDVIGITLTPRKPKHAHRGVDMDARSALKAELELLFSSLDAGVLAATGVKTAWVDAGLVTASDGESHDAIISMWQEMRQRITVGLRGGSGGSGSGIPGGGSGPASLKAQVEAVFSEDLLVGGGALEPALARGGLGACVDCVITQAIAIKNTLREQLHAFEDA